MKIIITLKDPDGVYCSINESVEEFDFGELEGEGLRKAKENRLNFLEEQVSEWLEYGEYAYLEYDTVTEEMTIKKPK